MEDSELNLEDDQGSITSDRRVSAKSRVNFSKLTGDEKDERLKNLSSLISRLRKKLRNQERRFKLRVCKNISTLIENNLEKKQKANSTQYYETLVHSLIKVIKMLRENQNAEFEDEKFLLDNLINLLAERKLSTKSINFKKICTQIRMLLDEDKIKYISDIGKNITCSFKDQDIHITPQEYEYYLEYKNNEKILRTIFGLNPGPKEYPNKITFDDPKTQRGRNQEEASNVSQAFNPLNNVNINNNILNQLISMYPTQLVPSSLFQNYNLHNPTTKKMTSENLFL